MFLCHEGVELEVATREMLVARHRSPFAEGDGLPVGGAVGQRVAAHDVSLQHIVQAMLVATFAGAEVAMSGPLVQHLLFQSLSAGFGVVLQQLYAIAGADGYETLKLPLRLRFGLGKIRQLPPKYRYKEIAVAAGRLEETAVEAVRLVLHKVEHGVYLAWICEHLAMVGNTLATLDLCCNVFVCGHKKSWNFAYDSLGVPRPAHQIGKAHDSS